ncbi:MAG: YggS family pyridoxal phosphate-dependent enzyme [Clostridia bacterium]
MQENLKQIYNKVEKAAIKSGRTVSDIKILAATKTQDAKTVNRAIELGITCIGENRVQDFLSKYDDINKNIEIHFIGSLQKNKIRYIIDKVNLIESVNSYSLAYEINKYAAKIGKIMDILIEINISEEESKAGMMPSDVYDEILKISALKNVKIQGLMAIIQKNSEITKKIEDFQKMYRFFVDIKAKKIDNVSMRYLSLGMSEDYELAIENGANLIRLGTCIFGKRE